MRSTTIKCDCCGDIIENPEDSCFLKAVGYGPEKFSKGHGKDEPKTQRSFLDLDDLCLLCFERFHDYLKLECIGQVWDDLYGGDQ